MNNVAQNGEKSIIGAIKNDKKEVQEHMDKLVRESVEVVLNELLNAEADALCNASRFERSPDYLDTKAGTYKRKLLTRVGEAEPPPLHRSLSAMDSAPGGWFLP